MRTMEAGSDMGDGPGKGGRKTHQARRSLLKTLFWLAFCRVMDFPGVFPDGE